MKTYWRSCAGCWQTAANSVQASLRLRDHPGSEYLRRFGSLLAAYARVAYHVSERQLATSEGFAGRAFGQAMNPLRELLGDSMPSITTIGVQALYTPEIKVEIEMVVCLP